MKLDKETKEKGFAMRQKLAVVLVLGVVTAMSLASGARAGDEGCSTWSPFYVEEAFEPELAAKEPVVVLDERATKQDPLVFEFEMDPGILVTWDVDPVLRDLAYVNLQVDSERRRTGLYVRTEWATPSISDFDTYLYNGRGKQVAWSEWFNIEPIDEAYRALNPDYYGGHGGMGYESMLGFEVLDCSGFTYEVHASRTSGEPVTVKAWLGKARVDW